MALDSAQKAAIIAATVAKVKGIYLGVAAIMTGIEFVDAGSPLKSLLTAGDSRYQDTVKWNAFKQLGEIIDRWATTYARWAYNGQRDDGTSYTLERWVNDGSTWAAQAKSYVSQTLDMTFFADQVRLAQDTQHSVVNLVDTVSKPTAWPWYVQAGIGVVALFYASQIFSNFRGRR